jgi:hypothetical protein
MTNQRDQNITDAKRFLRKHIKLMESVLSNLNSTNNTLKVRAFGISWILHNFMKDELLDKVDDLLKEHKINNHH